MQTMQNEEVVEEEIKDQDDIVDDIIGRKRNSLK